MQKRNFHIIGRQNRINGGLFEEWISSACDYYYSEGYACIQKTPEPVKVLSKLDARGRFTACFSKRAQPDFKGCLIDGTCIIFDVKHTDKDKITQSAISEEQGIILDKYEKMNAHCYVIVSMGLRNFYRVPWKVWKSMKDLFGHMYMTEEEELKDYKVPYQHCTVLFLEGVEIA